MKIRKHTGVVALGLVAVALSGRSPIVAQEPAPKSAEPAPKKKQDPARRVPAYFGQIGLTTEQRAGIYGLQAKHMEKIDALEKQIAAQRAQMLGESEAVLTETQKKLLDNLRRAASETNTKSAEVAKSAR